MKRKMKRILSIGLLLSSLFIFKIAQGQTYPYQNSTLDVEERVADLLSRMSLEEKVRQMDMYKGDLFKTDEKFDKQKTSSTIEELGVGAIHDIYPKSEKMINDLQKFVIKNNRWGIPALIMAEALHGYVDDGNTAFPMNIGLGATWDTDLMHKVGKTIGTEARGHGVHYALGPVLGIGREPRWGRVAETFGEDTYLASELGLAMVKGMQGDTLSAPDAIISEPKHFAVHSYPQAGGNSSPVIVGERTAREDFLPVFEKAYIQGGALGAMCAYSELDGVPCIVNSWLLTDVLRKEWGFKGIVISDLGAIKYGQTVHFVSDSPKEAIRQAVAAGVDMQFYDFSNEFWQETIIKLVKEGKLDMRAIDRAAGGVLRLKFLLGLFENPYIEKGSIASSKNTPEHQQWALEAARKSICLLKNNNDVLPLQKNIGRIAVIGPNANASRLGGYSVRNKKAMTVLEGIQNLVGDTSEVNYEEGVPLINFGQIIPSKYLLTPDGKQNGLQGEYFNNRNLEGESVLERIDPELEFDWPWFPGPGVNDDHFSIRWTGYLQPDVDFDGWLGLSSDDGIRMWLDDQLVIDNWTKGSTNIVTYPVNLKANKKYKLRIEMWEGGWGARAHLRWNLKKLDMTPAIELAKNSDVAIVVVGESTQLVEENRDVATLDLYGAQKELIQAIVETGTPVICVLLNGRPLSINWTNNNVDGILEAWFPGELGGKAVAEVLFGDYNPAGRLPITFPKSAGQLPIYYNQKPSAIHRYVTESEDPLYSFGYGLSYTTFNYSNLKINQEQIAPNEKVKITVDVENTGNRAGEEVVQLYINDLVSSVTTPRKTLKGFKRIHLEKDEKTTVTFELGPEELAIWDRQMQRTVEPGKFEIWVGGNFDASLSTRFTVTEPQGK
ncbi:MULTISPECIES: glycoside hydrolase family 3 protein [Flavobacteriaceae]|uniref:glycoside hydrolase family 3 protein n=1 Tax=Flavobacteriaceae TaxID=49546 RepID=UPI001490FE42|nr:MULTISPECIES: glycoside hydrolase family 3 protein [Allomuricauda]MDC6365601.1 glycoside hydrolase family 3 N-terminal domain-containing protein [Muricauda sp. AC10]